MPVVTPPPPEDPVAGTTAAEHALLAALRRGDDAAFDSLVRGEAGRLLALARRILRDEEEARDAVQDAFATAFERLPSFRGECRLSTWLFRIAANAALMRLRARRRRPEVSIEELLPRFHPDEHRVIPPGDRSLPDAEEAVHRREIHALVRSCIDRLPDRYRTVLLLRELGELSTGEAAELLAITPNAVKIRLHRARQGLRELLVARLGGLGER
ncbi:MAG TPA: sigma-70 family RNA polymerase sigma factor [Thermoanaerobaculia bacterium]|nr:sigma-70 family RNA polymerase sigma factor [Thermoanaerobaculia bacterium]